MHNPIFGGRGIVARFAQYAGFRPKAAKSAKGKGKKAADDDEDKKDDDENAAIDPPEHGDDGEDPSDDHMESDEDDERAESDDDDEKMSDDDDEDDDGEDKKKKFKKKAKRANRDDNDQDEDAENDEDKKEARRARIKRARVAAFKEGRRSERARWTKILSSPHASHNLDTALRLAANTSLPSVDVIAELRKVGGATASAARRSGNPQIGADTDGGGLATDQRVNAAVQASWAKAFAPTIEASRKAH